MIITNYKLNMLISTAITLIGIQNMHIHTYQI